MKYLSCTFRPGTFVVLLAFISLTVLCQDDSGRPLPQFLFPGFTKGVVRMKRGETFSSSLNYNMVDEIMVTELNGSYRYATRIKEFIKKEKLNLKDHEDLIKLGNYCNKLLK